MIWTGQILNICFDFFNCACLSKTITNIQHSKCPNWWATKDTRKCWDFMAWDLNSSQCNFKNDYASFCTHNSDITCMKISWLPVLDLHIFNHTFEVLGSNLKKSILVFQNQSCFNNKVYWNFQNPGGAYYLFMISFLWLQNPTKSFNDK